MEIKPIKIILPPSSSEIFEEDSSTRKQSSLPIQYIKNDIYIYGQSMKRLLLTMEKESAQYLTQIVLQMNEFKKNVRDKKKRSVYFNENEIPEDLDHVEALLEAYIGKILRLLKKRYDEKKDGVAVMLDEEGQLLINGINVHAFMIMASQYPTSKARIFLKGLKRRLHVILSNQQSSPHYERLGHLIAQYSQWIDKELEKLQSSSL